MSRIAFPHTDLELCFFLSYNHIIIGRHRTSILFCTSCACLPLPSYGSYGARYLADRGQASRMDQRVVARQADGQERGTRME